MVWSLVGACIHASAALCMNECDNIWCMACHGSCANYQLPLHACTLPCCPGRNLLTLANTPLPERPLHVVNSALGAHQERNTPLFIFSSILSSMSDIHSPRRQRIVQVWQSIKDKFPSAPLGPQCILAVGKQLKERSRFVHKWLQRWISSPGDAALKNVPSTGRPRKASYIDVAEIVHDPQYKSSFRVGAARSESCLGVHVSKDTIARAVHEREWHKHTASKCRALTSEMIDARMLWAKEHASHPWHTTLMVDSTVITYTPPPTPSYGRWGPAYEPFQHSQLGSQLHVYAGASPHGLSILHECTGSTGVNLHYKYMCGEKEGLKREGVGAEEAKDVLRAIIHESAGWTPELERSLTHVMLDRATPHTSSTVQTFLHKQGFHNNLLPAPGCDINWMDWAIWPQLKRRVYDKQADYENFQQFRSVVHEEWRKMRDMCQWGWLASRQAKRVGLIAKHGKLLH